MTDLDFVPDFSPSPMQRLLDYVIENYGNIEGLCPNTGLTVNQPQCVECNYKRFYGVGPIYSCQNFKKIYLIRFLITHIKQTGDLINATVISDIENSTNLSAISFGGGPGVEALALMSQLDSPHRKYELLFDNIDVESSWEPIYQDLVRAFSGWIENVQITPRFSEIDVIKGFTASEYDIVFVPWILSELDEGGRHGVLLRARDLTQPSKYVVVTDRPESDLIIKVSESIGSIQDWELIESDTGFKGWCGVHFPDELQKAFWVQCNYSTAYWVLKKNEAQDIPF